MFSIILRVLWLLGSEKNQVSLLVFANAFFALWILAEPIFFKLVLDTLVHSASQKLDFSLLLPTLIFWVLVWFSTIILRLYVSVFADRLAHMQVNINIRRFFTHAMDLSMRFHMNSNSGQLVKQITKGIDGIFEIQLNSFRRALPSIFILVFLIPVVLYFHFFMGCIVIALGLFSAWVTFYLSTRTFKKQENIEEIYSQLSAHYGDTFSNMTLIKSFTLHPLKLLQLKNLTKERIEKQFPVLTWWGLIVSFAQILRIITSILILAFGSLLYLEWQISVGEIVMFLTFALIFLSAIEDLTWTLEGMFWRLAGIKDYFKIVDTPCEVQNIPNAKMLEVKKGNISFRNLDFSYDGKRKVLKNIDIQIQAGEKIAFVWHTGSGKTTMTHMLLRFFEPQKGDITIDDISIYDVTQASLRKNIAVVFQDNSLFNTTVRENIRLDSDATDEEIEYVAKKSHCSDFIAHLTDGLDTIVWERGVKLSWGEKQRLAIARAFLKNAPILVLDEATSALDAQTEKYLQSSFDELMKGRTTIIIAHRLSTIMKADRIYVFDQGKIVESGDYESLLQQKSHFYKLVSAQTDGFIK
jgi:ATP-binding cassette, subfamily B, beta-glucan exporter